MSATTETFDWQGITLSVTYQPNWGGNRIHHIGLHVIAPERAALPVTETGYRSHFFDDEVESYGGLAAYVRAWLDDAAKSPDWQRQSLDARQFTLF